MGLSEEINMTFPVTFFDLLVLIFRKDFTLGEWGEWALTHCSLGISLGRL